LHFTLPHSGQPSGIGKAGSDQKRHSHGVGFDFSIGASFSDKSWSDAAQQAVSRASETMRHITGLDALHRSAGAHDGKIIGGHLNVKVAFIVEPAEVEP
jgi:flavin-binding protein dodecin